MLGAVLALPTFAKLEHLPLACIASQGSLPSDTMLPVSQWQLKDQRELQHMLDIARGDYGNDPYDGARTMMLVYNLPATPAVYQRFGGVAGSAYFVGGLGMTVLSANNIVVVPIRSGLGLRLGANVGYVKFTPQPTWNPF
jgi:hypothetical protein